MLKEENMAEKSLVLGELKVLGNVTGNNIKTITRDISSLSQSLSTVSSKQADYFRGIADDSIITPTEKNTLKKEWSTIQNTYTAIMELAEAKQVKTTNEIQNYMTAYSNLYTYLFVTIKVFDDMTSNTSIESKDDFNSCYDTYYECETYAQNRCAAGNDYWTLRILDSLDVTGTNNEVALYNGKFYKFSASKDTWEEVNTAQYLGCKTDFPASACIDDYFLMLSDTLQRELQVTSNGVLADSDAERIVFTWDVSEGSLYLLTESGWMSITDRNNWRYIVAQNDLIAHNYELSPALISFLEKEIPKAKKASYLGALTTPPTNYINGDWFTWASSQDTPWSGITLKKGHVYKFNAPTWTDLDPADSRNNNEFMEALNDLVDLNMGGNGYFNNLFVKKIFAMQAVINELQTKVIEIQTGGCVKTKNYVKGGTIPGAIMDDEGFESYQGKFKQMNAEMGVMESMQVIGRSLFKGEIISGPLELLDQTPSGGTKSYAANSDIYGVTDYNVYNLLGTYNGITFDYIEILFDHYSQSYPYNVLQLSYKGSVVYTSSAQRNVYQGHYVVTYALSFTYSLPSENKTFKLKNLPTVRPTNSNVVWNDNGTLKIT